MFSAAAKSRSLIRKIKRMSCYGSLPAAIIKTIWSLKFLGGLRNRKDKISLS
jgi:hypothetical protein